MFVKAGPKDGKMLLRGLHNLLKAIGVNTCGYFAIRLRLSKIEDFSVNLEQIAKEIEFPAENKSPLRRMFGGARRKNRS